MRRHARQVGMAAALVVVLLSARAAAEPVEDPRPIIYHVSQPFKVTMESGNTADLMPSYIVPDPAWSIMDQEFKRLQAAETQLTAENQSLKQSIDSAGPGWGALAFVGGALAAGFLAGKALN